MPSCKKVSSDMVASCRMQKSRVSRCVCVCVCGWGSGCFRTADLCKVIFKGLWERPLCGQQVLLNPTGPELAVFVDIVNGEDDCG